MNYKICNYVFIVLNIIASILYFIAFFTKNLFFLGAGGVILILNSIASMICDSIKRKRVKNK